MNRLRLGCRLHIGHRLESGPPKHGCHPRLCPGTCGGVEGSSLDRPRPGTRDRNRGIHPPSGNLVVRRCQKREEWRLLTIFVSQYKHQLVSMRNREGRERERRRGTVVVVAVARVRKGDGLETGWVLYKVVRTPNSQHQWEFLGRI